MSSPFGTNNPGIGGLDELTSVEEGLISSLANLGSAGQLLAVAAGGTDVEWITAAGTGDMLAATYDPATIAEQLVGLTATQTLTNKTLTSAVLNTGVSGTAILDEDNMASNSATQLATQQSIKAYVDAASGIANVVEDTTPQLGGALDGQGFDLNAIGVAFLTEQAAAEVAVAGQLQLWAKTATPNQLWYTDDAGTDLQVASLAGTETLTNKTINTASNNITIVEADISDLQSYLTGITGESVGSLSDVTLTALGDGEVLLSASGVWINRTFAEAGIQDILSEGAFVDGDKTKLDGIETGADVTDTANVTSAGALMDSELTDITAIKAASDAAASDVNTGTSTSAFITPDALAGSNLGTKPVGIQVTAYDSNVATGDSQAIFIIPAALNGMNLIRAQAVVYTAGTTNATTVMIRNKTDSVDMLSGAISIASAATVGTVGTINTATDDVATNDVIAVDVDSVSTTAPQGLMVVLEFQLP